MTRQSVNYLIKMAAWRAKLSAVHPHMLRHACGFCLANRGYDLRLIQDYLNHRDPKHTVHTRVSPTFVSKACGERKPTAPTFALDNTHLALDDSLAVIGPNLGDGTAPGRLREWAKSYPKHGQ